MSQIGVVNGRPLLAMPTTPGHRQCDWTACNVVGQVTNPFTGRQQINNWQAGWWEVVVTLPPMLRQTAEQWIAFLAQCQGMSACFYLGDGRGINAQGSARGLGVTAGSFQGGYLLTTKNWTPSQFALFSPGDWIQIGYRLHKVMDQPSSDNIGNASFAIWPPIREVPANGTSIITMGAQGLFCMKSNSQRWSIQHDRTYSLSFEAREAI